VLNGDSRNDVFKATVHGSFLTYRLEIFNRFVKWFLAPTIRKKDGMALLKGWRCLSLLLSGSASKHGCRCTQPKPALAIWNEKTTRDIILQQPIYPLQRESNYFISIQPYCKTLAVVCFRGWYFATTAKSPKLASLTNIKMNCLPSQHFLLPGCVSQDLTYDGVIINSIHQVLPL
jgi:hypothetical protein